MKKIIIFISIFILALACGKTPETDFLQKKYQTNDVKVISIVETDSAYSPHVEIDNIYRMTHNSLTIENYDSLYNEFLNVRREFIKPTHNNCIKKTYAIKVGDNEPYTHTIYYVSHVGNTCMHDKEMIIRQMSDIENNFHHFKFEQKNIFFLTHDKCNHY